MSATVQPREHQQRDLALERANQIRFARARLRRKVAAGEIPAAQVILEAPAEAQSWEIYDLLSAQWRWGRTRTVNLLSRLRIPERKQLGWMTERQRRELAGMLGGGE